MNRIISVALLAACSLSLVACDAFPPYHVYHAKMNGQAELAQADGNRQIAVQEAKAKLESAGYTADAEVAKAQGVAKANAIMSASLGGPEGYLRWKYIEMLQEQKGASTIYIPTEATLPILEANRKPG